MVGGGLALWLLPLALTAAEPGSSAPHRSAFLPEDGLFQPLLADPKEPRSYLGYQRLRYRSDAEPGTVLFRPFDAAVLALAGTFLLWGYQRPGGPEGLALGVTGGIFSQFNWDTRSADLMNTDFFLALPVYFRLGHLSTRVRVFHQSSHDGDELLLNNPGVRFNDLSMEVLDGVVSYEGQAWRVYGGAGQVLSSLPHLARTSAGAGLELRSGEGHLAGSPLRLLGGLDLKVAAVEGWSPSASAVAGLEWTGEEQRHRLQLLATFLYGYSPYGQEFFLQRLQAAGFELRFRY